MALCGEFFSQFRSFVSTLDRDCSELKSEIENNEISPDGEGRSHLILRGILSDAQKLKREVTLKSSENKDNFSFGEALVACERLAEHTKIQIEDLEEHLNKYGYSSPGELPTVDSIYEAACNHDNKESTSMDTDDVDNSHDNSQSEDDVDAMETDVKSSDEGGLTVVQGKVQDDLLSTPVKPDTITPMIQATPPPLTNQNKDQSTPDQSPVPPQTTTPMFKVKQESQSLRDNKILSPPNHDTPPQPLTYTPLIKASKPVGLKQTMVSSPPDDNSPLPPVLYTPGIRMMGVPGQQVHGLDSTQCPVDLPGNFGTPTPPDLTCTKLLQPDELEAQNQHYSNAQLDSTNCLTLQPIVNDEYRALPDYVKTQFSVDDINELLLNIEEFLKLQTEDIDRKTLPENVLREYFCLGRKTKAFMLALKKTWKSRSGKWTTTIYHIKFI